MGERSEMPRAGVLLVVCVIALAAPVGAPAQIPAIPVLQNAWANPGTTVALNVGSASGSTAYAAAAAWAPKSTRYQLSGALGSLLTRGGRGWASYGARVAVPVVSRMEDRAGLAVFGGIGGARRDTISVIHIPIGAALGYRHALGDVRSVSGYLAPFFVWTREHVSGVAAAHRTAVRASVGIDLALARSIGITFGYELGGTHTGVAGVSSHVFGAGLSYAFH